MRDTSSRKLFLAGASLTALTACSGAVTQGLRFREIPEAICEQCPPGGGGSYTGTGGLNPAIYKNFVQSSGWSAGWNSSTGFGSGANKTSSSLYYTGTTVASYSSTNYSIGGSLNIAGVGNISPSASANPQQIQSMSGGPYSGGTISTSGNTLSATITVKGTPCLVSLTSSNGQNFSLTYKNLQTGASWSTSWTLPSSVHDLSDARHAMQVHPMIVACCSCWALLAAYLFLVAIVLGIVALPEELAGAAYAIGISQTIGGLNFGAAVAQLIGVIEC